MRHSRSKTVDEEVVARRRELLEEHKEYVSSRDTGVIFGELFVKYEMIEQTEASEYYVLEKYKILIPVCTTAGDTFQMFATFVGDWALTENVSTLPVVECKAVHLLIDQLGYEIVPVLSKLLTTMPAKVITPMMREAIQKAKRLNASIAKQKHIVRGKIDLDL